MKLVALMVLDMGGNVAIVFRGSTSRRLGKVDEVINGDENDLRFLDKQGGYVVGLIEKGLAKKDETGFVQEGINS